MDNLYDILEVSRKASKEIIEKAYKTLAKKYHPDVQSEENKKYAEEKMKQLNEAYSILSDDMKRAEYDAKLEQEENKLKEQNYANRYKNEEYSTYSQDYNKEYSPQDYTEENYDYYNLNSNINNTNVNTANANNATNEDWRYEFQKLSPKEQKKLMKKIQREANEEYRKNYEAYFKSLGYKIKHKWTIRDVITVLLVFVSLAIIVRILWIIPFTHNWMINFYNDNWAVQIVVNLFIGLYNGIVKFIENIGKF